MLKVNDKIEFKNKTPFRIYTVKYVGKKVFVYQDSKGEDWTGAVEVWEEYFSIVRDDYPLGTVMGKKGSNSGYFNAFIKTAGGWAFLMESGYIRTIPFAAIQTTGGGDYEILYQPGA